MQTLWCSIYKSRRCGDRRDDQDGVNTYVDVHGHQIFGAAMVVMMLCILDAFFTLILLGNGAEEVNPFLAWLLEIDTLWFYTVKYIMTAVCVLWIVMHKSFSVFGFKGRHVLLFAVACYTALISYQLTLLFERSLIF